MDSIKSGNVSQLTYSCDSPCAVQLILNIYAFEKRSLAQHLKAADLDATRLVCGDLKPRITSCTTGRRSSKCSYASLCAMKCLIRCS